MTQNTLCAECAALPALATSEGTVALPAPELNEAAPLMKALAERCTAREYGDVPVTARYLSHLLWAAVGFNRPDGRRTSPTALNKQEISVYVIAHEGAWVYDPAAHTLSRVTSEDLMPVLAGHQDFVPAAPMGILFVGDTTAFQSERAVQLASFDAGIAAQSTLLMGAAEGLACVIRATMDCGELIRALSLPSDHLPLLNIVLGTPKV